MLKQHHRRTATSRRDLLTASVRGGAILAATAALHGGAVSAAKAQAGSPIEGSWLVTTTDPTPSTVGIISHTAGGVVIQSNPNPALSAGHGAWMQTGEREYLITFLYLRRDEQGKVIGTQKVRRTITLDDAGASFTGAFQNEVLDLAGNVERSNTGTVQGSRILPEPLV